MRRGMRMRRNAKRWRVGIAGGTLLCNTSDDDSEEVDVEENEEGG